MKYLLMAASAAFFMACTNKQNSVETADCSLPVANSYLQDSYAEVPLDQYLRIKDALVSSLSPKGAGGLSAGFEHHFSPATSTAPKPVPSKS